MNLLRDIATVKTLLTDAELQALALGDTQPEAEHLVLAALRLEEDSARSLLGVTADQFRDALVATHASALGAVGVTGAGHLERQPSAPLLYRSGVSAREVLGRARLLSKRDRPRALRGSHIVRAAAERDHGTVARVLDSLGIDRKTIR